MIRAKSREVEILNSIRIKEEKFMKYKNKIYQDEIPW